MMNEISESDHPKKKKPVAGLILVGVLLLAGSSYFGHLALDEHQDYRTAEQVNQDIQDIAFGKVKNPVLRDPDSDSDDKLVAVAEEVIPQETFPQIMVEDDDRPHVDEAILPDHEIVSDAAEAGYEISLPEDVKDPDDPYLDWYMSMQIYVSSLQEINQDVICWVYVPNTGISYPVFQESWDAVNNNTRSDYIYENIYREYSIEGSLFVKAIPDGLDPAMNGHMTIYGHNMANGSMFATLVKYKQESFFKNNPYIYLFYPDRTERWAVWSAGHIVTRDSSVAPVYLTYLELGSDDYQNCINFLDNSRYYSTWVTGVDANTKTLTLSTCDWVGNSHDGRMVVTAVKDKTLLWKDEVTVSGEE